MPALLPTVHSYCSRGVFHARCGSSKKHTKILFSFINSYHARCQRSAIIKKNTIQDFFSPRKVLLWNAAFWKVLQICSGLSCQTHKYPCSIKELNSQDLIIGVVQYPAYAVITGFKSSVLFFYCYYSFFNRFAPETQWIPLEMHRKGQKKCISCFCKQGAMMQWRVCSEYSDLVTHEKFISEKKKFLNFRFQPKTHH